MTVEPLLSIVVAVKGAEANLPEILTRLARPVEAGVEIVLVAAGPAPAGLEASAPGLRVLESEPSSLVPHLWRDGVRAARSDRVAFTNSQCIPAEGWVEGLLAADIERWAGVGGPIGIDPEAGAVDWAVYFLRYISFAPPIAGGETLEIAADNAVYRRPEIMRRPALLATGFWEPSFHKRFREDGMGVALDPTIPLAYRGPEDPRRFLAHRFAHGRAYGSARSRDAGGARRLAYLAASPAVPLVLLQRIVRKALGKPGCGVHLVSALPWLLAFCLAWSAGEARGYLDGLVGKERRAKG